MCCLLLGNKSLPKRKNKTSLYCPTRFWAVPEQLAGGCGSESHVVRVRLPAGQSGCIIRRPNWGQRLHSRGSHRGCWLEAPVPCQVALSQGLLECSHVAAGFLRPNDSRENKEETTLSFWTWYWSHTPLLFHYFVHLKQNIKSSHTLGEKEQVYSLKGVSRICGQPNYHERLLTFPKVLKWHWYRGT